MTEEPRRLRVLMLNYEFPPIGGGTGTACRELLRAFEGVGGLGVDLVTAGLEANAKVENVSHSIVVHRVPVGKRDLQFWRAGEVLRWTWRARRLAGELIGRTRYDLCHCWAGWPPGLLGYAFRRRLPYLVSLRGSDVPGYNARLSLLDPLLFRRLSRRVWREAAAVVAVSDELRRLALRTMPSLDVSVIPNAVDGARFTPGAPAGGFTILFVGRLIPRKGVGDLVRAFRVIADRVPGARLVVVGEGPDEGALQARVRRDGLEGLVTFLGPVANEDLPPIYRSAKVFVLPSHREGMPNVLLEAMASGLPVVTTAAAAEIIDGNGLLVEPGDATGIADAVLRYAGDEDMRRAHGRRSRAIAESMSWDSVARWHLGIYRQMTGAARRGRGSLAG